MLHITHDLRSSKFCSKANLLKSEIIEHKTYLQIWCIFSLYFTLIPGNCTSVATVAVYGHTSSVTLLHILYIYSEGRTVAIKKVPKHDLFLNHTVRSEVMQIRSVRAYLTTLSLPICKLWRKKKKNGGKSAYNSAVLEASANSNSDNSLLGDNMMDSERQCACIVNPPQAHNSICYEFPFKNRTVYPKWERGKDSWSVRGCYKQVCFRSSISAVGPVS